MWSDAELFHGCPHVDDPDVLSKLPLVVGNEDIYSIEIETTAAGRCSREDASRVGTHVPSSDRDPPAISYHLKYFHTQIVASVQEPFEVGGRANPTRRWVADWWQMLDECSRQQFPSQVRVPMVIDQLDESTSQLSQAIQCQLSLPT
jgi:hypothetical protein